MPPFRCYKMQETEFCPFRRTQRVDLRTPFQLLLEMLNNVNGRRPTAFLADPGLSDQGKQIPVYLPQTALLNILFVLQSRLPPLSRRGPTETAILQSPTDSDAADGSAASRHRSLPRAKVQFLPEPQPGYGDRRVMLQGRQRPRRLQEANPDEVQPQRNKLRARRQLPQFDLREGECTMLTPM